MMAQPTYHKNTHYQEKGSMQSRQRNWSLGSPYTTFRSISKLLWNLRWVRVLTIQKGPHKVGKNWNTIHRHHAS